MKLLKLLYIQTFMTNPQHSKHYKKTFHCETILPVLEFSFLQGDKLELQYCSTIFSKNIFTIYFLRQLQTVAVLIPHRINLLHILSFPRLMKKQLKLKNIFSNSFFKLQNTIIYFESLYCPLFHNYLHLLYKVLSIPFLNIYIITIYMNVFYVNLIWQYCGN